MGPLSGLELDRPVPVGTPVRRHAHGRPAATGEQLASVLAHLDVVLQVAVQLEDSLLAEFRVVLLGQKPPELIDPLQDVIADAVIPEVEDLRALEQVLYVETRDPEARHGYPLPTGPKNTSV